MNNEDRRLITDKPELTGYLDGYRSAADDTRDTRKYIIPDGQRKAYEKGFRRGVKGV